MLGSRASSLETGVGCIAASNIGCRDMGTDDSDTGDEEEGDDHEGEDDACVFGSNASVASLAEDGDAACARRESKRCRRAGMNECCWARVA